MKGTNVLLDIWYFSLIHFIDLPNISIYPVLYKSLSNFLVMLYKRLCLFKEIYQNLYKLQKLGNPYNILAILISAC